jgi:DNA (cytosine-5)-methyltransferase 1
MKMKIVYNDNDAKACAWVGELVNNGHLHSGQVWCRSIKEITPDELADCQDFHTFAGIGGWPYALRLAGWPTGRQVWTGSCPCQPFSTAGKGLGEEDPRHLWPDFRRLIAECRPDTVFGEQVASKSGREWLARVRLDLEDLGYAVGAADLCAAGAGAPHLRQRLFWVANSDGRIGGDRGIQPGWQYGQQSEDGGVGVIHDANKQGPQGRCLNVGEDTDQRITRTTGVPSSMGDSDGTRLEACDYFSIRDGSGRIQPQNPSIYGFWDRFTTIDCSDGKTRRIKPGIQPLVAGIPGGVVRSRNLGEPFDANATAESRVMRLRGYGNAICPQIAAIFIRSFLEAEEEIKKGDYQVVKKTTQGVLF